MLGRGRQNTPREGGITASGVVGKNVRSSDLHRFNLRRLPVCLRFADTPLWPAYSRPTSARLHISPRDEPAGAQSKPWMAPPLVCSRSRVFPLLGRGSQPLVSDRK